MSICNKNITFYGEYRSKERNYELIKLFKTFKMLQHSAWNLWKLIFFCYKKWIETDKFKSVNHLDSSFRSTKVFIDNCLKSNV